MRILVDTFFLHSFECDECMLIFVCVCVCAWCHGVPSVIGTIHQTFAAH